MNEFARTIKLHVERDLRESELGDMIENPWKFEVLHVQGELLFTKAEEPAALKALGALEGLVAWKVDGKHVGGVTGIAPTNRNLHVEGVSYLGFFNDHQISIPLEFKEMYVRRFIDWHDVHAQVGIAPGRQVLLA